MTVRDIAEPERLAVGEDGRLLDRRDALHGAADAQRHALCVGLEFAGGRERVLLGERVEHGLYGHAERGELGVAELDVDSLALVAQEVDLGHVGQPLQPLAKGLGDLLQLRVARAVAGDRIKHRVDVAELVVHRGADHVGRQIGLHVGHFLAQQQEQHRHFARRRRILEDEGNRGKSGLGVGLDLVGPGQFLQLLLDPVGDLPLHLFAGCARPEGADVDVLDRERGVLGAAETRIGERAGDGDHQDQEGDELRMPDPPIREIEPAHQSPARFSTMRTFCMASSLWTPSATISAPSASPEAIQAESES